MSAGLTYTTIPLYCVFSKEKSPACDKLGVSDYKGNGIIYERDEYGNKPTVIPDQASVLIMSSEMDPLTPKTTAEALLDALRGDKKELITFPDSTRSSIIDSSTSQDLCGMAVLSSFVKNNGDLTKLNKTCVAADEKSLFNWTTPIEYQHLYLSTEDAYDGNYDASLSKQESGSSKSSLDLKDLVSSDSQDMDMLNELLGKTTSAPDAASGSGSGEALTIEELKKMLKDETSLLDSGESSKSE